MTAPAATPVAHDEALDRPIRVLLVDDNHDTLKFLSRLLALARPSRPHRRRYGLGAPRRITRGNRRHRQRHRAPDGSGLELLWTLRATRSIPAIALSGFGAPADIEQSRSAGFAVHLTKPVDFQRLDESIRQCAAAAFTTS